MTGRDETQLSERSINDGITCWGRSSVLWDHPDPASRSGLWSLSCVLIGCLQTLLSPDWSRLGAWPWPRRAQTKCRLQSASRWVESVGWGKVHRPIERSINIFHRTLPHAQKRSKVMFPVDQGATKLMQGMSVCTLAHLWGGSNSYGQISAPQGSYTKSHLMKWSEYISIPMIQRTSIEFLYKGHFYNIKKRNSHKYIKSI